MAKINVEKDVTVNTSVDVDMDDFYNEMSKDEKEEMASLLSDDIDVLDFIGRSDRQKMYKELAYYVGNSDPNT